MSKVQLQKGGGSGAAPAKKSGSKLLVWGVLAVAAVLGGVFLARSAKKDGDSGIVFTDRNPDGSYPNVTSRIQILDFGVKKPRAIDGPIPFKIARKVEVEDWSGRKDNIAEEVMLKRSSPVILRNSVVSRWPALAKWTPEYFRTSVPSWRNISRARALRRCFINWEPNNLLDRVTPWDFWENKESREEYPMPMAEFFEKAQKADDGVQWFFAEELPKELHNDVSPRHQLKLKDQTWVYFGVWMGEGGATTAAHWDMDSNLYAQFYGRKRFLLFDPRAYKLWKSYPRLSPNHKQVQMEPDNPSRFSYRLVPGAELPVAYEAILYPGDLLYIPAYWYHHVEAMVSPPGTSHGGKTTETEHLSISANFWSTKSMDFLIAQSEPLPMSAEYDKERGKMIRSAFPTKYPADKVVAMTRIVFASDLAESAFGVRNGVLAMARQIGFLRYVDLFGPPEETTSLCPPPLSAEDRARVSSLLAESVQVIVKGLKGIDPGAAETEMLNFIELCLSPEAVPTDRVYPFLHNCFHHALGVDKTPDIAKVFPR